MCEGRKKTKREAVETGTKAGRGQGTSRETGRDQVEGREVEVDSRQRLQGDGQEIGRSR